MSPLVFFLLWLASPIIGLLNPPLRDSYDYIVCGCGISGLVVANRLSEDYGIFVLCIEAGEADNYEEIIQDPVYVGADVGGIYDWNLATTPQTQLDGAPRPIPQGKVLGGGSILNAMCWNRGGRDDYDVWETLGNPGWNWNSLLPYFKKSETYTPVYSNEIAQEYSINYNPDVHGFSGPVQVSYPKYFYPQSINLFTALNYLGIPTEFDQAEGITAGAVLVPTDLDPINQTRSDARRAYFDPYAARNNFHVITGQHVTRVLIQGLSTSQTTGNPTTGGNDDGTGPLNANTGGFGFGPGSIPPTNTSSQPIRRDYGPSKLRITGVEFASSASSPRQTVYATREVIIAAGALHSVQLMQLSGIGPAALLQQLNITVALDLPGVGNNYQDHCLVGTFYPYNNASFPSPAALTTNATFNAEARLEYTNNKSGPWTAGSPNALAFPSLPLISKNTASILTDAASQGVTDYLVPSLDPTVVAGFADQKKSLVERLGINTSAAYEIINNNAGSLTVAVMHPLSRGVCYVNSADPFQPPQIDPRWLSNPVDRQILVEALQFNRQILAAPSMLELQPAQFVPPIDADEAALNLVISNGIRTEFHPSGTLAMLPLNKGGVVDAHLIVYGTQNLRVVDASIFPIIPAAHMQAPVYAVAEKAADIIKAGRNLIAPSPAPAKSSSSAASTILASTVAINPSTFSLVSIASVAIDIGVSGSTVSSAVSDTSTLPLAGSTSSSDKGLIFGGLSSRSSASVATSVPLSALNRPTSDSVSSVQTTGSVPDGFSSADPTIETISASRDNSVSDPSAFPSAITTSVLPATTTSVLPTIGDQGTSGTESYGTPDAAVKKAALEAFIVWLLRFFHLGG